MSQDKERAKGEFLTPKQRSYLMGHESPPNKNAEYQRRAKIRARTEGALSNLGRVGREISNDDAQLIFEDWETASELHEKDDSNNITMPGFINDVHGIIGFAYRGYRKNGMGESEFISKIIEPGIRLGHAKLRGAKVGDVEIDVEMPVLEVHDRDDMPLLEKFEREMGLSKDEWTELYQQASKRASEEDKREMGPSELIEEYLSKSEE